MAKVKEAEILDQLTERELRDYAGFFDKNKLEELEIEEGGLRVVLKKESPVVALAAPVAPVAVPTAQTPDVAAAASEKAAAEAEKKSNYKEIRSPIVGTFYDKPSPDSDNYVKVGDTVNPDTKVCIVEAMKIMNEISAGVAGKVVEVLVKSGQSVQANQVLMYVE